MKVQGNRYINNPEMIKNKVEKKTTVPQNIISEDDVKISDSARKLVETALNKVAKWLRCYFFTTKGGMTSDSTARKAINNVITREALINCDFSGNALDGVDQAEVYIRDAYILRDMRKDYNLFNSQLGILGTEKETFTKYLLKEKTISDIADDQGITYESARQQMQKIKVRMKKQVKRFMDGQPGGIA